MPRSSCVLLPALLTTLACAAAEPPTDPPARAGAPLECAAPGEPPAAAHRALVEAFFAARERGELDLPALLFIDGHPASETNVRAWFDQPELLHLADYTPVHHIERPHPSIPEDACTIAAFTGVPPPDCVDPEDAENCEGFEWAELSFDPQGRLVALGLGAAG